MSAFLACEICRQVSYLDRDVRLTSDGRAVCNKCEPPQSGAPATVPSVSPKEWDMTFDSFSNEDLVNAFEDAATMECDDFDPDKLREAILQRFERLEGALVEFGQKLTPPPSASGDTVAAHQKCYWCKQGLSPINGSHEFVLKETGNHKYVFPCPTNSDDPNHFPSAAAPSTEPAIAFISRDHPEGSCQRCDGPNVIWFAPNEVWNKATAKLSDDRGTVLCPLCFIVLAEEVGAHRGAWLISPEVQPAAPISESRKVSVKDACEIATESLHRAERIRSEASDEEARREKAVSESETPPPQDLEKMLDGLKRSHLVVDDCWYSCPKSGECCDDNEPDECRCGADEHNSKLTAILDSFSRLTRELTETQKERDQAERHYREQVNDKARILDEYEEQAAALRAEVSRLKRENEMLRATPKREMTLGETFAPLHPEAVCAKCSLSTQGSAWVSGEIFERLRAELSELRKDTLTLRQARFILVSDPDSHRYSSSCICHECDDITKLLRSLAASPTPAPVRGGEEK